MSASQAALMGRFVAASSFNVGWISRTNPESNPPVTLEIGNIILAELKQDVEVFQTACGQHGQMRSWVVDGAQGVSFPGNGGGVGCQIARVPSGDAPQQGPLPLQQ